MTGVGVAALTTALIAQPPAGVGPAPEPLKGAAPGGKGGAKGAPQYRLEKGQSIDTRPTTWGNLPIKAEDHSLWQGQTRAPFEPSGQGYDVKVITDKLVQPWAIVFLPDGKMLITEKPGNLRTVTQDGVISEPLKGVPKAQAAAAGRGKAAPAEPVVPGTIHYQGQVGLLDLALDKNFDKNRRIFYTYSENVNDSDSHIVLASATLSKDDTEITGSKVIFGSVPALSNARFGANQGGRIAIDREGNVFVIIGDRAPTPPTDYAQMNNATIGKILHLTPDGKALPKNPFYGKADYFPEIYSMGHRSPEGLAINPANGELWEIEHGPQGGDELNKIEAGKNYGWPVITHGIDYNNMPIKEGIVEKAGMEQPRYYWNPVIAPSGLAFYQGSQFPGWKDSVFVGGLGGQLLDRLHMDWKTNKVIGEEPLMLDPSVRTRIRDVRFGPDGMIYVLSDANTLFKITPKK
jgi:glucose/arabinose dehydrogenase